jgi:hypothetical protein
MSPDARRNVAAFLFGVSVAALLGGLYFLAVRYLGPAPNYARIALTGELRKRAVDLNEEAERDAQVRAAVRTIRLDAEPDLRFGTPEEKALARAKLELAAGVEAEQDRIATRRRELQQEVERVARRRTQLVGVGLTLLAVGFSALGMRQLARTRAARTPPAGPA